MLSFLELVDSFTKGAIPGVTILSLVAVFKTPAEVLTPIVDALRRMEEAVNERFYQGARGHGLARR